MVSHKHKTTMILSATLGLTLATSTAFAVITKQQALALAKEKIHAKTTDTVLRNITVAVVADGFSKSTFGIGSKAVVGSNNVTLGVSAGATESKQPWVFIIQVPDTKVTSTPKTWTANLVALMPPLPASFTVDNTSSRGYVVLCTKTKQHCQFAGSFN